MKILVTGAGGFIGSHLVKTLKNTEHKVFTTDKVGRGYNCDISLDLSNYAQMVDELPHDVDIIYHIAAQTSGYIGLTNPSEDVLSNTLATLNVCRFAKQTGVEKIIYTSSMAVYGNGDDLTEESELDPLSHYAVSKYSGELYCRQYGQFGISHTIFRLFNVYGHGQDMKNLNQGMASIYLAQALKNNHIDVKGSFDRYRDFVYVDDVVNALMTGLLPVTDDETYNVATGKGTTVKELLDIVVDIVGTDTTYKNIGQYDGDQDGTSGLYDKLKNDTNWNPTIDIKAGMKKFYVDLCNENVVN